MSLLLRCLCFLACIPSGGALLLKVWGVTSMAWGGALFLACLPVLIGTYAWAGPGGRDPELARALRLGAWGGLAGTLGYDLVRVPMHYLGYRVFAPISAYGVWLLEADRSTGWSEAMGWLYHFSNGLTFGVMYALWLGRRHWVWGLLWGLCLESIILSTPFARIFHMQGNYPAIAIAYGAHLAYGFPLGYLVKRWELGETRLVRQAALWAAVLVTAFIVGFIPEGRARDSRARAGHFLVEGPRLNPTWLRLPGPGMLRVANPGASNVTVWDNANRRELVVPGGQMENWRFDRPGIYQCYVKTGQRSISSFVIVEPVESN